MLTMTTQRHKMFVCIPGLSGDSSSSFGGIGEGIDATVDRLLALCRADEDLKAAVDVTMDRMAAMVLIWKHVKAATPDAPWMRASDIATPMCRRVLYLMHPNRFGFEKYGWIH